MRCRPTSIHRGAAAVVLLAALGAGCSSSGLDMAATSQPTGGAATSDGTDSTRDMGEQTATAASSDTSGSPGLLYVQRAASGAVLAGDGSSGDAASGGATGTLRLEGVNADTVWFQDRPGRQAGRMTTRSLVDGWESVGFVEDPPNATLQIDEGDGPGSSHVVELSSPAWDEATGVLTYAVRSDGASTLPAEFGAASLFIDDADADVFRNATLQVSNLQPGQTLSIGLDSNGAAVSWSTGDAFGNGSGLELHADSGPVPVVSLDVSPSTLVIDTSSSAGGSALDFSVQVALVGAPGIDTFYVSSGSDPGVEVTIELSGSVPQVVNQSQTLFSWNPA